MGEHSRLVSPPLVEVVCGVAFEPFALDLGFISDFRQALREEYPRLSLQPVWLEPGEQVTFAIGSNGHVVGGERAVLESHDGVWIVQFQANRLFVNWRNTHVAYPGMIGNGGMLERFYAVFSHFFNFVGEVNLKRVEITKINHLVQGHHWHSTEDVVAMLPFLRGLYLLHQGPELNFNIKLSDNTRLPQHIVNMSTVRMGGAPNIAIQIELSTRRACVNAEDLERSFVNANEAINDRFFSVLSEDQLARFGGVVS